jgi:hypothetical protein
MSKLSNVSLTICELEHRSLHVHEAPFPYVPVNQLALEYSVKPEHTGGGGGGEDRKQTDLLSELEYPTVD